MKITPHNISDFNQNLRHESPTEIIKFALQIANKPILTTSFGAHSAAILHACVLLKKDLKIVWCDTGYNTEATYQHAQTLIKKFNLNIDIFTPNQTSAFINATLGQPEVTHPDHEKFTKIVKIEPFERALQKHNPDVWFTNLRKSQNSHRENLDILSFSKKGVLKVSPFFYFSDTEMASYLRTNGLPTENDYKDPVKALKSRECGIHFH